MSASGIGCRSASWLLPEITVQVRNKHWPDCIVTLIDLIGIKDANKRRKKEGTRRMIALQKLIGPATKALKRHDHVYCWNDSVLLLHLVNKGQDTAREILSEIRDLKRQVDHQVGKSLVVCVKGQIFPPIESDDSRCTFLKTTSYAMANCLHVEAEAKKRKLRARWYIDSWLKRALDHKKAPSFLVTMLPKEKARKIFLFEELKLDRKFS